MYRVEITNQGGMKFNVKSKDYEFTIDTKGQGITPPDTLLASLGSCIGVYLRKYIEGARIALDSFAVTVEGELSQDQPVSFKDIKVTVTALGLNLDERRKTALLAFVHNCPIHNTIKSNPAVEIGISGTIK